MKKAEITPALVERLVDRQFPQWAHLPVAPVELDGWDNRTFRLGDDLTVRLPSADGYAPQVEKEQRWLPALAPHLPLPDSRCRWRRATPGEGYPVPWSVYRWLPGEPATARPNRDLDAFAGTWRSSSPRCSASTPATAPRPARTASSAAARSRPTTTRRAPRSRRSATRSTRRGDGGLGGRAGRDWPGPPVWFHGDVAAGNLLVATAGWPR